MKYRVAWYGLLLSVVLNMVLAALLWYIGRQEASALTTNLYLMDGEGENWTVINYKVVIDQERIKRGEARLRYIGSMAIDQSEYFGIEVIEDHETVYNTIHTSQGGLYPFMRIWATSARLRHLLVLMISSRNEQASRIRLFRLLGRITRVRSIRSGFR